MDKSNIASLAVSKLGIGCNNFGLRLNASETEALIHGALDLGVNYLDTADMYGGTQSEVFIGKALKGRRDQAVIGTKFGMALDEQRKGAHPDYIRQACHASLDRLQTDYIDLYILHTPDSSVPIADTLGALTDLVSEGKVRELGCSNFSAQQLKDAQAASENGGGSRFVNVQNEYSLLNRDDEQAVLPACAALDLSYSPYFPLASGLLTGKYKRGEGFPSGSRLDSIEYFRYNFNDENMRRVEALTEYAESYDRSLLTLAVSWLLANAQIPSVIAGATSIAQIEANIAACSWELSAQQLTEINQLS